MPEPAGPHRPSVKDLISRRLAGEGDDYVLAVAIDGGGMRGVVSGAILIALRDLGIDRIVDRFYGSSAAALNLAQYSVGASWDALAVYYDYLPTGLIRKFPHNVTKPMLDMGYLDLLFRDIFPLDPAAIKASPLDVRIVLADVDSRTSITKSIRDESDQVIELLKASAWLPILSGQPVVHNGSRFLDGGVLMPHPLYAAITDGCTHVLAVSPKPANATHSHKSRRLLRPILNRWAAGLGDAYVAGRVRWDADSKILSQGESTLGSTSVTLLAPTPGSHEVTRLTTDKGMLLQGARVGYEIALEFFGKTVERSYFTVVSTGTED